MKIFNNKNNRIFAIIVALFLAVLALKMANIAIKILLAIIGLIFYFLPAMIAFNNNHPRAKLIFVLNIFFGWTLIGWIVLLIWAFSVK